MTGEANPLIADLFRAADGVFAVDADQRITFWSRSSERFLGISAGQALGRRCYEFIRGCDSTGRPVCGAGCRLARCLTKQGAAPETFAIAIDGGRDAGRRWVSIVLAPSPRKGLWTAFHVLHPPETKPARASQSGVPPARRAPDAGDESLLPQYPACTLTAREQEILQLLAAALPVGAISRQLYISRPTVRNHIQHILAKLEVHSKLEAVAYAYRHQLVDRST
jgi:DNA-binding CsgD family transcriptional regulator